MRIALRADASGEIGTGHVMRCLTLARALRAAGAACRFVIRALPGHMAGRIEAAGFDVALLPASAGAAPDGPPVHAPWAGVAWTQDAAETRAALDAAPPDWLVMDHYAFEARWQAAARPAGTRLMVIDDLADRPHACDLLLDQNLGHAAADYDGLVSQDCTRLTGPKYALLRPEFAAMRAGALSARAGRGLRHLLVTMGGVDRGDATSAVLRALCAAPLPEDLRITVVMGATAPALDRVRAQAEDMPRPTQVAVNVSDMAAAMAAADFAIGAGGGTTWELCALGLPGLIVETADNQAGIARAMAAAGAAFDAGPIEARGFAQRLHAALAEAGDPACLDAMSEKAAALCDGDGAARAVAVLLTSPLSFRAATRADSRRVWEWRNTLDQSARKVGEDTLYIRHDAWFCRALNDPDRIIRILMQGDLPLGYLRLDRASGTLAHVSICLGPEARGRGLGRQLLEEADRVAKRLGLAQLYAEVHPQNAASRRVFEMAGYVEAELRDGFLTCHRTVEGA